MSFVIVPIRCSLLAGAGEFVGKSSSAARGCAGINSHLIQSIQFATRTMVHAAYGCCLHQAQALELSEGRPPHGISYGPQDWPERDSTGIHVLYVMDVPQATCPPCPSDPRRNSA